MMQEHLLSYPSPKSLLMAPLTPKSELLGGPDSPLGQGDPPEQALGNTGRPQEARPRPRGPGQKYFLLAQKQGSSPEVTGHPWGGCTQLPPSRTSSFILLKITTRLEGWAPFHISPIGLYDTVSTFSRWC